MSPTSELSELPHVEFSPPSVGRLLFLQKLKIPLDEVVEELDAYYREREREREREKEIK